MAPRVWTWCAVFFFADDNCVVQIEIRMKNAILGAYSMAKWSTLEMLQSRVKVLEDRTGGIWQPWLSGSRLSLVAVKMWPAAFWTQADVVISCQVEGGSRSTYVWFWQTRSLLDLGNVFRITLWLMMFMFCHKLCWLCLPLQDQSEHVKRLWLTCAIFVGWVFCIHM